MSLVLTLISVISHVSDEKKSCVIISRADIGLPVYPRLSILGGKNIGQP